MRARVAESGLAEVQQAEGGAAEEAAVLQRRLEQQAVEVQEAARRAEAVERAAESTEHVRQAMRQAVCAAQVRAREHSATTSPRPTLLPRDSESALMELRLPPSRSPRSSSHEAECWGVRGEGAAG
eukprot:scaffold33580_cov33-Phaeocystis_antarctica.AAC.1